MSMIDCLSKQYITSASKNISIKQHINNKKYLYGRNIDHKSISVREYMVYYLLLTQQIPLYV